jgi:hypothetical protein
MVTLSHAAKSLLRTSTPLRVEMASFFGLTMPSLRESPEDVRNDDIAVPRDEFVVASDEGVARNDAVVVQARECRICGGQ